MLNTTLRALHDTKVRTIQSQIKGYYTTKQRAKIYHGSSNSTRPFTANGLRYVDVSALATIIEINNTEGYALVEPNVALDALVKATAKQGLIPPMVAEFPGITVGGAVQGGSGESSSFKWGTFDETCLEYEVVLGDGEKIVVSPTEHSDLFSGLACAFGSLGVLTLLKIKLVPAATYVKLAYYPVDNFEAATADIQKYCQTEADFVDGILFSKDNGVIMVGSYTNAADLPVTRLSRLRDEWFYIHARHISRQPAFYEELIPLKDYLFRYDKGAFWVAKLGFNRVPFNRLTRLVVAGLLSTRTLFKLLHGSNYGYVYLAQDLCLPRQNVTKFLEFADTELNIYPLWLCPLKPAALGTLSPAALATDLVINVGVWGEMKPSEINFSERNRGLEATVFALGGRKVLYAHAYYTRAEFWDIYNQAGYEKLRADYHADIVFPDVYQKTSTPTLPARPSKLGGLTALFTSPYKPQ